MVLIPAYYLQLIWIPTAQSGFLRAPSAGCWFSLPHLISNFLRTELYYCFTPTQFNLSTVKVIPMIPSTGCPCNFLFWQLGRGQYATQWILRIKDFPMHSDNKTIFGCIPLEKCCPEHDHIVIYKALCFDVVQGQMNGVPNETRTHSCRFASLAC